MDRKLLAVALIVALGSFTVVLDMTIVGVALHTVSDYFDSSLSIVQWVTTAYILSTAMVVPLTGWATDRFGGRRLWMFAVALFTASSVACGLSWSVSSLIAFRVLQGIGAGLMAPVGTSLVARTAGPERMGRAMGLMGIAIVFAPVVGPVIGGVLVDLGSWRWIFFLNLPIGLIALALARAFFDRDRPTGAERIDVAGFLLLCPGITLLVFGLAGVSSADALTSPGFLVPTAAGSVLGALFVRHALRTERPLLDLRLFRNRTFSATVATQFLMNATLSGSLMLLPLYFQLVRGASPLESGLLLVPEGLGVAMIMPIAGRLVDRGKAGPVILCGLPMLVLGFLSFTQAGADASMARLVVSLWLIGVGAGCTIMPAMSTAYRTIDGPSIPRASATLSIAQEIGASTAVAVFVVVLDAQLRVRPAPDAFDTSFWLPLTLTLLVLVPALLVARSAAKHAARTAAKAAETTTPDENLANHPA
ncbi:MAG TPA: DHA2 family efflux MFS transporter permease subunit [Actinophytocola sp.]|jgi:EmrB/QacA subfamily drug resistance transporter|nr:DHA2 family efflux MFS transporter permease subunit [Actinophytocola sp.]